MESTKDDNLAIALYAILARDACDFLDMAKEANNETLKTLYLMLATPQDNPRVDQELNSIGANFVKRTLENRGVPIPALEKDEPPVERPAWFQESFKF